MNLDLKAERMNRGLTLAELADAIDVPKSTLARVETTGTEPKPKTKLAIANFVGRDVIEIWPVENENPRTVAAAGGMDKRS